VLQALQQPIRLTFLQHLAAMKAAIFCAVAVALLACAKAQVR
jgi:hypothetical protein